MLIYSGRPSEGARSLARALGIRRARAEGPTLSPGTVLVNWGNTQLPARFRNCYVINTPEDVACVSNKLRFFESLAALQITPRWADASAWARTMTRDGIPIVCRTVLSGSGGVGIVIAKTPQEVIEAPLYVEYIKKQSEYRVHILRGNIIDIQRKARRHDVPDDEVNWEVRNLEGGFIYARENINAPVCVTQVAEQGMAALALDFGACDVLFNAKQNRAYLLEINSAPGLEGTTVENYANAFRRAYL